MAQDEKMLVPMEPTREMWAAGANAVIGYKQRHHDKVVADVWSAMLSAAPAQPAAVEASRKDFVGEGDVVKAGVIYGPLSKDYLIGVLADRDLEIATLRARPSPTPAADADEMAKAVERLKADADYFDHPEDGAETHRRALCWVARDIRTVLGLAALKSTPPADDALRVAVEALEDAAHEAHGRGYVQGFADAVWDETGDYDEKALTENLDPEKLRDGWYDDARHTYRDAQTEALAALKAGGVK